MAFHGSPACLRNLRVILVKNGPSRTSPKFTPCDIFALCWALLLNCGFSPHHMFGPSLEFLESFMGLCFTFGKVKEPGWPNKSQNETGSEIELVQIRGTPSTQSVVLYSSPMLMVFHSRERFSRGTVPVVKPQPRCSRWHLTCFKLSTLAEECTYYSITHCSRWRSG